MCGLKPIRKQSRGSLENYTFAFVVAVGGGGGGFLIPTICCQLSNQGGGRRRLSGCLDFALKEKEEEWSGVGKVSSAQVLLYSKIHLK